MTEVSRASGRLLPRRCLADVGGRVVIRVTPAPAAVATFSATVTTAVTEVHGSHVGQREDEDQGPH